MSALEQFHKTHRLPRHGTLVVDQAGRPELVRLFADLGFRTGAEIGVWQGGFSKVLCERVPGLRLRCVDPWQSYAAYQEKKNDQQRLDNAYASAVERLRPFAATIVRKTSVQAAGEVPDGSLDFVYIDANHAEAFVRQDLDAWVPKVRRGGIVSGHDYTDAWAHLQVKPAVDAFVREHRIDALYVLTRDKSPSWFWVVA